MVRHVRLFGGLALANILAWVWAWVAFADRPALLGTALLAWVLGLRHAVDADHIAAIDNVVRKLLQQEKRADRVGLFFALGHSTIVIAASAVLAVTAAAFQATLESWRDIGGILGTSVSAAFLCAIGLANLVILVGTRRSFRAARAEGRIDPAAFEAMLAGQGFLTRFLRPLFHAIERDWHMYPLGFLFGLGFDTATEVGLLGLSATQAANGLSPWSVMVFPALFTAGMALVDTADGVMMARAYGWAFVQPLRKLWYNLTMTAASVLVALLIGGIEALGLIADHFGLEGPFWREVAGLGDNLGSFGFVVVGAFALAWGVSALVFRLKGYDRPDLRAPVA